MNAISRYISKFFARRTPPQQTTEPIIHINPVYREHVSPKGTVRRVPTQYKKYPRTYEITPDASGYAEILVYNKKVQIHVVERGVFKI